MAIREKPTARTHLGFVNGDVATNIDRGWYLVNADGLKCSLIRRGEAPEGAVLVGGEEDLTIVGGGRVVR